MNSFYKKKYNKYKRKYLLLKGGTDDNLQNLEFPYYHLYYDLTIDKFNELFKTNKVKITHEISNEMKKIYHGPIEKFKDEYLFIELNWQLTKELDEMSNYFTEPCRIKCNTKDNISPYDYWQKNKMNLITATNNMSGNQIRNIRNRIYENNPHCTTFKISAASTILKLFNAKKWLDISAGWGDRLLTAIGHKLELYCGVDPNKCLHPYYKKMIEKLVPENERHKYILIEDGFETASLPDEKFDLVLSSPPFFDVEEYSEEKKDSLEKYKQGDEWYHNFLFPSIKKAYNHLDQNGHLVLYIGEGKTYKYTNRMLNDVNKFMRYLGKIYYYYDDKFIPRRFFVWIKN